MWLWEYACVKDTKRHPLLKIYMIFFRKGMDLKAIVAVGENFF